MRARPRACGCGLTPAEAGRSGLAADSCGGGCRWLGRWPGVASCAGHLCCGGAAKAWMEPGQQPGAAAPAAREAELARRLAGCCILGKGREQGGGGDEGREGFEVELLAQEFVVVYESPDPMRIYCYSPGLARCPNGRLVATMDLGGPGVRELSGVKGRKGNYWAQGKIFVSDNGGRSWRHVADFPFMHARPFVAGGRLYVLGHMGDLMVMRSDDWGESWGEPVKLTEGETWHQAPCNVWYARGNVYLVMEKLTQPGFRGWPVHVLAPVVMAAREADDLVAQEAWRFSNELSFRDVVQRHGWPNLIGVPFFKTGPQAPDNPSDRRTMNVIGWLETNIVQVKDPEHVWYDPAGRTFHLLMRAHTGSTNLACLAKAVEMEDGSIVVDVERAPSGEVMVYIPLPGGQMKFHVVWDEETELYWLLSSQATDSMRRPEKLPAERFNLPNNERHRLALWFSRNLVDWCFAGMVAMGASPKQSRHYASMVIDGDDLVILSRSGDERAKSAHDGNLITFHRVRDFRRLAY